MHHIQKAPAHVSVHVHVHALVEIYISMLLQFWNVGLKAPSCDFFFFNNLRIIYFYLCCVFLVVLCLCSNTKQKHAVPRVYSDTNADIHAHTHAGYQFSTSHSPVSCSFAALPCLSVGCSSQTFSKTWIECVFFFPYTELLLKTIFQNTKWWKLLHLYNTFVIFWSPHNTHTSTGSSHLVFTD